MKMGTISSTLKHWRCGGILCSVCLVPLLIKDTKAHRIFRCSALFVWRSWGWVCKSPEKSYRL